MSNIHLISARNAKNDEFYTQYFTIEKELINYKNYLRGKIIYCNCDMISSNFVKFLNDVKEDWKIKDVWNTSIQDGYSFDSEYSLDLLSKCDVVITNPPFSLARQFFDLLFEYNKDFLIIASALQISYKPLFYKIMSNDVNIGLTIHTGKTKFLSDNVLKEINVRWFTNIKPDIEHEPPFIQNGIVDYEYEFFDDTDIINVPSYKLIPDNYTGVMGVPITCLDKLNRKQFEIVGYSSANYYYGNIPCYTRIDGYAVFSRLLIRRC